MLRFKLLHLAILGLQLDVVIVNLLRTYEMLQCFMISIQTLFLFKYSLRHEEHELNVELQGYSFQSKMGRYKVGRLSMFFFRIMATG